MKQLPTKAEVRKTEVLTIADICARNHDASNATDMTVKYVAAKFLSEPSKEQARIQKELYAGAKVHGMRDYEAMKQRVRVALQVIGRKSTNAPRGKQESTNPETIRKNLKARATKNKAALKEVVSTKEGIGHLIDRVIGVAKISKALQPIEMSQLTALLAKVTHKSNLGSGTTVRDGAKLIHAAD